MNNHAVRSLQWRTLLPVYYHSHQHFFIIDKVKESIAANAVSIIPCKLPFQLLDICAEVRIFSELWINEIPDLLIELWANILFRFFKGFGFCNFKFGQLSSFLFSDRLDHSLSFEQAHYPPKFHSFHHYQQIVPMKGFFFDHSLLA